MSFFAVYRRHWRDGFVEPAPDQMRLSIVTVCLNDLPGLRATYASVHSQTRPPDEWIVVDGGSSDGTTDWLEEARWAPLRWTSGRDGGIYEAMNKGLRQADADYVLFLNSGDTLAGPRVLETVVSELVRLPDRPVLLMGDSFEVDRWRRANLRRARPSWWVWLGMPTTHQAMFFRSDALADGFDTRYRLSSDYAAVAQLYRAQRGTDFHHLPQALCHFHLGGRSDQWRGKFLRENLEIRRRVLGMRPAPALLLHLAHLVHGWVKYHLPWLHGFFRYG